jgi:hypothetical protein
MKLSNLANADETARVQAIMLAMAVEHFPNVYYIGKSASNLTFSAQQQRALNLVWALKASGVFSEGKEVAIVGGGLAGMTAALAAMNFGAHVHLFERMPELLHLQRGSHLRFIHPNILSWPRPGYEKSKTNFPCLNWSAGSAAEVVEQVLRQWNELKGPIQVHCRSAVQKIQYLQDEKPLLRVEGFGSESAPAFSQKKFDCVIAAVGFGVEKQLQGSQFVSYWHNDNYGRPVISMPVPRAYVVSGTGDGGCIDAIRLSLTDFEHSRFLDEFMPIDELSHIRDRLIEIEEDARNSVLADPAVIRQAKEISGADASDATILDQFIGAYYWQEYDKLTVPTSIISNIRERLRKDTIVTLNDSRPSPLSFKSSLVNRFLIYLLRKHGRLHYAPGRLKTIEKPYEGRIILIERDVSTQERIFADEIVARHGADSALLSLFPAETASEISKPNFMMRDETAECLYPSSIYDNPQWLRKKQEFEAQWPFAQMRPEQANHIKQLIAVATVNSPTLVALSIKTISREKTPLVITAGQQISLAKFPGTVPNKLSSITCFLKSPAGNLFLITSATALALEPSLPREGDEVCVPVEDRFVVIGKIAKTKFPTQAHKDSKLSTNTIVANELDYVLVELDSFIVPSYMCANVPQIRTIAFPEIGLDVTKIGSELNAQKGQVIGIQMLLPITRGNSLIWYQDTFEVNFPAPKLDQFTQTGDGGAPVIANDGSLLGLAIGVTSNNNMLCLPIAPMLAETGYELWIDTEGKCTHQ